MEEGLVCKGNAARGLVKRKECPGLYNEWREAGNWGRQVSETACPTLRLEDEDGAHGNAKGDNGGLAGTELREGARAREGRRDGGAEGRGGGSGRIAEAGSRRRGSGGRHVAHAGRSRRLRGRSADGGAGLSDSGAGLSGRGSRGGRGRAERREGGRPVSFAGEMYVQSQ